MKQLKKWVDDGSVDTIIVAGIDLQGRLYGKRCDAGVFLRDLSSGIHTCDCNFGWDIARMLVDDLKLVLMECVRGPTMKELFRKPSDNEWMVRTAAEAVATLHSLPYEGGDVRSVQSELTRVRRNAEPLHLVASELAGQLDDVLDRIARLADRLACPRPCVIHGALRPAHLIIVVDDVALIDLDGVGLGDPAFDLAEFMSKCMTQAQISNEDARAGLSEYFLAEYQARVGTDEGLADRVRIICGLTFVTRAIRSFLRAPHRYANEPQSSRPVKYLKEAAACLDRLNG